MDVVRFEDATVRFDRLTIEGPAGRFSIEPKVLNVLRVLLDNHGEVVSREYLIDAVWGVGHGGDERLSRAVSLLRKALGDKLGNDPKIQTVPKRGYRLRGAKGDVDNAGTYEDRSLAILPFANSSQGGDSRFLADGLCIDLTNLLSRVPHQHVAPHSSAIQFLGSELPIEQIGRHLNVRYVVTGTYQVAERKIRLRTAVYDRVVGRDIWSEKYDAELDHFFELQEEIVRAIATKINSEIAVAILKDIQKRPAFNLTAYEHIQLAEAERWTYNREAGEKIVGHLRAALDIDPDNPFVHAALTVQLGQNITSWWTDDIASTFAEAQDHLRKAQAIAPNEPDVLIAAGVLASMTGRADEAVPPLARAIELDPNNPHARALYGWQYCCLNRDPAGVDLILSAEREAPHHPRYGHWASYRGHAEYRLGNFEASLAAMEQAIVRLPAYHHARQTCHLPLTMMGRMAEAKARIREALNIEPRLTLEQSIAIIHRFQFQSPPNVSASEMESLLREAWPD